MSESGSHRRHVDHCLNCGAPSPRAFCPECGQEAFDAAVTFRQQMAHFLEEVIGVESRLPQTMKLLLTRPGALTRAYNSGQRVRFVTPLKLYLFASVAFFLLLSLLPGRQSAQFVRVTKPGNTTLVVQPEDASFTISFRTAPGEIPVTADDFDAWLKEGENGKTFPRFLQPHVRAMLKSPDGFVGSLIEMASKASMALVPIHALFLKLLYWRPRRLYGEHIVFSLHVHSFAYLANSLAAIFSVFASAGAAALVNTLVFLWSMVYLVVAARTAYVEGIARSAFKMAVAGIGYGIALVGVLLLVLASALFEA